MDRRRFLQSLAACGAASPMGMLAFPSLAQSPNPPGDTTYAPISGQSGKDVVWIPTPEGLVRRMLEAAQVTKDDLVYDLGAGDGRICIAAAKLFGATAKGIEYNDDLAKLAQRNADQAGVGDKVEIITGDIFDPRMKALYTRATVITLYLLPDLNRRLRPTLLEMRPGTRVVSHAFTMGDWEPDQQFTVEGRDGFYWLVPANVAGRWLLHDDDGWGSTLDFKQRHQRIGGTMTTKGKTQQLLGCSVNGEILAFNFIAEDGTMQTVRGTVRGKQFEGGMVFRRTTIRLRGERR